MRICHGYLFGLRILIMLQSISSLINPSPMTHHFEGSLTANLHIPVSPSSVFCQKNRFSSRTARNGQGLKLYGSKYESSGYVNSQNNSNKEIGKSSKKAISLLLLAVSCLTAIIVCNQPTSLSALLDSLNRKSRMVLSPVYLRDVLVDRYSNFKDIGITGVLSYTLSFIVWTMTLGNTVPFEVAGGTIFGARTGFLCSIIAKPTGSVLNFLIVRHFCYDMVHRQVMRSRNKNGKGNNVNSDGNMFELVKETIKNNPLQASLIIRFSPLPEFLKHFVLAVSPVPLKYFTLAVLLHGLPYSCLWTLVGAENKVLKRGASPNQVLEISLAVAGWLGFLVSPTMIGLWARRLKSNGRAQEAQPSELLNKTQTFESEDGNSMDHSLHEDIEEYVPSTSTNSNACDELHYIKNFRPAIFWLGRPNNQVKSSPQPFIHRYAGNALNFVKGFKPTFSSMWKRRVGMGSIKWAETGRKPRFLSPAKGKTRLGNMLTDNLNSASSGHNETISGEDRARLVSPGQGSTAYLEALASFSPGSDSKTAIPLLSKRNSEENIKSEDTKDEAKIKLMQAQEKAHKLKDLLKHAANSTTDPRVSEFKPQLLKATATADSSNANPVLSTSDKNTAILAEPPVNSTIAPTTSESMPGPLKTARATIPSTENPVASSSKDKAPKVVEPQAKSTTQPKTSNSAFGKIYASMSGISKSAATAISSITNTSPSRSDHDSIKSLEPQKSSSLPESESGNKAVSFETKLAAAEAEFLSLIGSNSSTQNATVSSTYNLEDSSTTLQKSSPLSGSDSQSSSVSKVIHTTPPSYPSFHSPSYPNDDVTLRQIFYENAGPVSSLFKKVPRKESPSTAAIETVSLEDMKSLLIEAKERGDKLRKKMNLQENQFDSKMGKLIADLQKEEDNCKLSAKKLSSITADFEEFKRTSNKNTITLKEEVAMKRNEIMGTMKSEEVMSEAPVQAKKICDILDELLK